VSGLGGEQATISNLWEHGGFFPNGVTGLVMMMAIIMFSFGGLELVGITAAEASEPRKVIPKAINQVVYRILIFYIGALTVLLALYPWDSLVAELNAAGDPYSASPFVRIFSLIGSDTAAHALNFVVLTAARSVYNSGVYCNSRMLYGLAEQGDAPRALMKVNRRGVPVLAIGVSALVTLLCVLVNYLVPQNALEILMSLVVATLVINWAMISLAHLKFRRAMKAQGVQTHFPAIWAPFSNYLCLAFVLFILGVLLLIPGIRISVFVIPFWLLLMWFAYLLRLRMGRAPASYCPSLIAGPSTGRHFHFHDRRVGLRLLFSVFFQVSLKSQVFLSISWRQSTDCGRPQAFRREESDFEHERCDKCAGQHERGPQAASRLRSGHAADAGGSGHRLFRSQRHSGACSSDAAHGADRTRRGGGSRRGNRLPGEPG